MAESGEVEIKVLLQNAKKVFKKFNDQVDINAYADVLASISVFPENESELEEYFRVVDTDGNGFVSYQDFEDGLLNPMLEQEQPVEEEQNPFTQSSTLSLETLSAIQRLFDLHKKETGANIMEMKEDIIQNQTKFGIKFAEFDQFYEDYLNSEKIK
jgi:hypothetical protein